MRQPVHVVYGGANLFKAATATKLGALARKALAEFAPRAEEFAQMGVPDTFAPDVRRRVAAKLESAAVEDYRIDFEDGYGYRSDEEEDGHARNVAEQIAAGMADGTLPEFLGIRIKPLSELSRARSLRTLRIVRDSLKAAPPNFVVTLPKVTAAEQVRELASESPWPIEIMIETGPALLDVRDYIAAAGGRCRGAHFGPYDFMSSLGVFGTFRGLAHPACDYARMSMLAALAGSGIWLSDGPTSTIPVPPKESVQSAWKLHYSNVRRALENGYYQGWDLHPAQFVSRYAAVYTFFLEGMESAAARLKNFVDEAGKATMVGASFDDAATAEGMLLYVKRAIGCGAVGMQEASAATGLTVEELQMASFVHILKGRNSKEQS